MAMATATVMSEDTSASVMEATIARIVAEEIAKANLSSKSQPVVEAANREAGYVAPKNYLEHYRNDLSPDVQITVSDVTNGIKGEPFKGRIIKFRRGHFFATEQYEVDFLEWVMANPLTDPRDSSKIIGGIPSIYKSDGKDIVACPECGEAFVAGSNALKSHRKASHGA